MEWKPSSLPSQIQGWEAPGRGWWAGSLVRWPGEVACGDQGRAVRCCVDP